MIEFTVSVVLNGDLDADDAEGAEVRAQEIAEGLRQLAQDLGLQYVSADYEVEEL